ncbi:MAG: hypothetical protein ACTSRU_15600, partial [Candidatus Hodarchaeales archaeon]
EMMYKKYKSIDKQLKKIDKDGKLELSINFEDITVREEVKNIGFKWQSVDKKWIKLLNMDEMKDLSQNLTEDYGFVWGSFSTPRKAEIYFRRELGWEPYPVLINLHGYREDDGLSGFTNKDMRWKLTPIREDYPIYIVMLNIEDPKIEEVKVKESVVPTPKVESSREEMKTISEKINESIKDKIMLRKEKKGINYFISEDGQVGIYNNIKDFEVLYESLKFIHTNIEALSFKEEMIEYSYPGSMKSVLWEDDVEFVKNILGPTEIRMVNQEGYDYPVLFVSTDSEYVAMINNVKNPEQWSVIDTEESEDVEEEDIMKMGEKEYDEYISYHKDEDIAINGYVENGVYFTIGGESIKIGDYIEISFMGSPDEMPKPWTLVGAKNVFSTVSYNNSVTIIVKASNGKKMTFNDAHQYSPHPGGAPEEVTPKDSLASQFDSMIEDVDLKGQVVYIGVGPIREIQGMIHYPGLYYWSPKEVESPKDAVEARPSEWLQLSDDRVEKLELLLIERAMPEFPGEFIDVKEMGKDESFPDEGVEDDDISKLDLTKMEDMTLRTLIKLLYAEEGFSDITTSQISSETGIDIKKMRGVVSSLIKKGIISVIGEEDFKIDGEDILYLNTNYYHLHPSWKVDNLPVSGSRDSEEVVEVDEEDDEEHEFIPGEKVYHMGEEIVLASVYEDDGTFTYYDGDGKEWEGDLSEVEPYSREIKWVVTDENGKIINKFGSREIAENVATSLSSDDFKGSVDHKGFDIIFEGNLGTFIVRPYKKESEDESISIPEKEHPPEGEWFDEENMDYYLKDLKVAPRLLPSWEASIPIEPITLEEEEKEKMKEEREEIPEPILTPKEMPTEKEVEDEAEELEKPVEVEEESIVDEEEPGREIIKAMLKKQEKKEKYKSQIVRTLEEKEGESIDNFTFSHYMDNIYRGNYTIKGLYDYTYTGPPFEKNYEAIFSDDLIKLKVKNVGQDTWNVIYEEPVVEVEKGPKFSIAWLEEKRIGRKGVLVKDRDETYKNLDGQDTNFNYRFLVGFDTSHSFTSESDEFIKQYGKVNYEILGVMTWKDAAKKGVEMLNEDWESGRLSTPGITIPIEEDVEELEKPVESEKGQKKYEEIEDPQYYLTNKAEKDTSARGRRSKDPYKAIPKILKSKGRQYLSE